MLLYLFNFIVSFNPIIVTFLLILPTSISYGYFAGKDLKDQLWDASKVFLIYLNLNLSLNFKDSLLSSSKFYGQSYQSVTVLRTTAQQDWGN